MPFIKKKFYVDTPTKAFLFVMRELNFTQGQAQRHVAKGRILINNKSIFESGKLIHGPIEMVFFQAKTKSHSPIFKNNDFMIFEKPSGTLVHPNTMSTPYSMLDEIRHYAGNNANAVHRIDMETSGLLLASNHKSAESYLKGSFENRTIEKSYLAWVDGKMVTPISSYEPLKTNNSYENTKHKVFVDINGKPSHTDFKPILYDEKLDASLVACYPHTGRTHQIRVHLFHMKHPILGDPIYGSTFEASDNYLEMTQTKEERLIEHGAPRLMLHAQSLTFNFGAKYHIESKLDFKRLKSLIHPKENRAFNTK